MQKSLIILSLLAISALAADFSSPSYQAQSRAEKLQQLITNINEDTTSGSFPSGAGLVGIFKESMKVSLEYESDAMPDGRVKYIHSVGNTAQVQFVAESGSPYTGLFQGSDSAIIRLSLAKQPDYTKTTAKEAYDNFVPGFGLKFLVDGLPSVNLVAMYGVNGVDTWNFFGRDFSNHIPGAQGLALIALAQKFSEATQNIQTVGLKDFAAYDQQGRKVDNPKFPWKLIFRAPESLKNQFTDDFQAPYVDQLKTIPAGSILYDVYAVEDPAQACEQKIGSIKLVSQLNTSKFGDEQLFFKHQKMENDLAVHPENTDYTPFWSLFGNRDAKKAEGKCPFAAMFI